MQSRNRKTLSLLRLLLFQFVKIISTLLWRLWLLLQLSDFFFSFYFKIPSPFKISSPKTSPCNRTILNAYPDQFKCLLDFGIFFIFSSVSMFAKNAGKGKEIYFTLVIIIIIFVGCLEKLSSFLHFVCSQLQFSLLNSSTQLNFNGRQIFLF